MKKLFALSALLVAFMGCSKDDVEGNKPKLTFLSVSATDIPLEGKMLAMEFKLQDGDGDTEKGLYVNDSRFNIPGEDDKYDEVLMPSLENHRGGKLDALLTLYSSDNADDGIFLRLRVGSPVTQPDTVVYKVFVMDNAGNSSDTLTLPKIAIHY